MLNYNLQFFADDAAGAMADTQFATGSEVATSDGAGASAEAEGSQSSADTETFDSLIKGKYKADYDASVKKAIDRRFRNQKDFEGRLTSLEPMLQMIADRYGVDASDMSKLDVEALTKAVENDQSMYEKEAFERGMDVETLKHQKALERENRQLRALQERQQREAEGRQQYEQMMQEQESVRAFYPDFDLEREMQTNERFGRTLVALQKSGVTNAMKTAYEVCYKDQILAGGMQYAAQKTAEKVANSIRSGRPLENGVARQQAASTIAAKDPKTFTKEDFARIKREAERGIKVYLT